MQIHNPSWKDIDKLCEKDTEERKNKKKIDQLE